MKKLFFLLLAGSQLAGFAQAPRIENLVFEGAGIRGIAYSGVVGQLEKQGLMDSISRVGGTSAGAITALLVSLGYSSGEMYDIISRTKFQQFNDGGLSLPGGLSRLASRYGWYKGRAFTRWIADIIAAKTGDPDITLQALSERGYKQLYVTATCLNKQALVVLSAETYPQMKVKDAIRISMSIPLYFEAVFIDSLGKVYASPRGAPPLDIVVDGGIIGNFPIFLFDSTYTDAARREVRIPNGRTLGVRIDEDAQIRQDSLGQQLVPQPIDKLSDYLQAFYLLVLETLNRGPLLPEDWARTISVSSAGIGPRIKKLSEAQKRLLIRSGETHTEAFLRAR